MARSETHDLGHLYCHAMRVPRGGPLVQLGTSHEVEKPWRVGRCVVLRLWALALVLGWWGRGRSYEEMVAEEAHLDARLPTVDEIREDFRPQPGVDATGWSVR